MGKSSFLQKANGPMGCHIREGVGYSYYDVEKPHEDLGKFAKECAKSKARRILDLGSGLGRNAFPLIAAGCSVACIDSSPKAISALRKNGVKGAVLGDIFARLPFKDSSFDAVIAVQSLQHARDGRILRALSEVRRVLRKGGLFFLTVCGRHSGGKVRYCLVKTARKVAERTYVPTIGDEKGLVHFIYDKRTLSRHLSGFRTLASWKDSKDYYCVIARKHTP